MKYEMIFGDERLFAGVRDGIVALRFVNGSGGKLLHCKEGQIDGLVEADLINHPIVAMRRIIKEPVISGDIDDLIKDEFSEWWEKEGCIVRSGGGDRERTFAFAAFRKLMPEILAARGLKKTPVWTKADQLAGRLPEVSCRVDLCHKLNTNWRTGEIKYIDNQVTVIKADDIDRPFVYEFDRVEFKPIETPAEKAQRFESEWVESAFDAVMIVGVHSTEDIQRIKNHLRTIYRAQLSGELAAPKGGE